MKRIKDMVAEANAIVDHAPAEEMRALHGTEGVMFVDLRDPRELEREGMIPGAFHCPRGMLEFWIDPESPYAKPQFQTGNRFVFYCASGWRSALSARAAQEMGLENVSHITDGFTGWKAAGGPVGEKPVKAIKPSEKKICPECGHIFQGNGWDGIDAHWKSKHDHLMAYEDAWPLLKSGKYPGQ